MKLTFVKVFSALIFDEFKYYGLYLQSAISFYIRDEIILCKNYAIFKYMSNKRNIHPGNI